MNTCVSDGHVVINIQGIRTVTWGESSSAGYGNAGKPYYIQIVYKGNSMNFSYKTEAEVREIFKRVREAMDKTYKSE